MIPRTPNSALELIPRAWQAPPVRFASVLAVAMLVAGHMTGEVEVLEDVSAAIGVNFTRRRPRSKMLGAASSLRDVARQRQSGVQLHATPLYRV